MTNNSEFSITENVGIFSEAIIKSKLIKSYHDNVTPSIYQDISLFNYVEKKLIATASIMFNLNNSMVEITFQPKIKHHSTGNDWEIRLILKKKLSQYFFMGNIGIYANCRLCPITRKQYSELKEIILEICNGNLKYDLSIINEHLLNSEIPPLIEWANLCSEILGKEQTLIKKK